MPHAVVAFIEFLSLLVNRTLVVIKCTFTGDRPLFVLEVVLA